MLKSTTLGAAAGLLAMTLGSTPGHAQNETGTPGGALPPNAGAGADQAPLALPATPAAAPTEPTDMAAADAELRFGKTGQLSGPQQEAQAEAYAQKMQSIHDRVKRLAGRARADRDLIKLNCVNDKLLQIRGNLNVADQTRNALKATTATGDEGGRNHEFSKLTIIYQKVTVLGQEAEACAGEEVAYVGQTRVTVEIAPEVEAAPEPSEGGQPLSPAGRPPLASPYF